MLGGTGEHASGLLGRRERWMGGMLHILVAHDVKILSMTALLRNLQHHVVTELV